MAKKRYMNTREQSFFGNYLYDQIVPQDHFLRLLNQTIDWDRFTNQLIEIYRGGGEYGRPPFNPAQLLKMCLLAYFYDLSERQTEVYVNEDLPAKYFVGLGIDQPAPDHSTLSRFRARLTRQGSLEVFELLMTEIVQMAVESGIEFGSIQVIDSVHSEANVNTAKDSKRKEKGEVPHDPDAKWGVKGKYKVKNEKGEEVERGKYFFGNYSPIRSRKYLIFHDCIIRWKSSTHSGANRPLFHKSRNLITELVRHPKMCHACPHPNTMRRQQWHKGD